MKKVYPGFDVHFLTYCEIVDFSYFFFDDCLFIFLLHCHLLICRGF